MRTFSCPSCGAEVNFVNAASVFAVCGYCHSTIVRHDVNVELLGQMAQLNDSWSPMQLTTQGTYDDAHFVLVGRVKLRWERGTWDEWYCAYDDGRTGWLSEAQGIYHLSFPAQSSLNLPAREEVQIGATVRIDHADYEITDIKKASVVYSEGELPFRAVPGRISLSVDLSSTNSGFASIDYSEDGVSAYCGEYLSFKDLRFNFLRELDGWGKPR